MQLNLARSLRNNLVGFVYLKNIQSNDFVYLKHIQDMHYIKLTDSRAPAIFKGSIPLVDKARLVLRPRTNSTVRGSTK